jgi:hypothetical protein
VGAPGAVVGTEAAGAVFVYSIHWHHETQDELPNYSEPFVYSNGSDGDRFGAHVAVFGSRFIVGAENALSTGAAFLADLNESIQDGNTSAKRDVR